MRKSKHFIALAATIFLSAVFAIAQTEVDHEPSQKEMAQGRDLKLYDDGGDFYETRMDAAKAISLREFIWNHWTSKKRGYIRFAWFSMDTGGRAHIFIEPTKHGRRHIVLRDIDYWVGGDLIRWTLYDLPEVTRLERAKPEKNDYRAENTSWSFEIKKVSKSSAYEHCGLTSR